MKSLLAGLAALAAGFILFPTTASADRVTFMGRCPACGVPMYGQTVFAGYDRFGQPVYQTFPVGHQCQGRHYDRGHHSGYRPSYSPYRYGGYGSRGYGYSGYGSGRGCDSRPRTGFSISIFR